MNNKLKDDSLTSLFHWAFKASVKGSADVGFSSVLAAHGQYPAEVVKGLSSDKLAHIIISA